MHILAATDFSTRSSRALRQAGLLAQSGNAQLHLIHVVDDDRPQAMILMEKREAERMLTEQIDSMSELRGIQSHPMVVTGDPFDGILQAASQIKPDLIVMGSHRQQLLDIFVGTTIERVIRKGTFPVLMVRHQAQRKYENVIAPIDMTDASVHAVKVALATGLASDKDVTLLHAFLTLMKGKMTLAGVDKAGVEDYVGNERQRVAGELAAFLVTNDLNRARWSVRVEEGSPMQIISRAVQTKRPDLLVMGTRSRSGLLKVLIGSVTEEALRTLDVDILAVPPVR
jgi:nucleotide-binding universal stress UspA family protein